VLFVTFINYLPGNASSPPALHSTQQVSSVPISRPAPRTRPDKYPPTSSTDFHQHQQTTPVFTASLFLQSLSIALRRRPTSYIPRPPPPPPPEGQYGRNWKCWACPQRFHPKLISSTSSTSLIRFSAPATVRCTPPTYTFAISSTNPLNNPKMLGVLLYDTCLKSHS